MIISLLKSHPVCDMDSETYAPDFNISDVYLFWEQVNFIYTSKMLSEKNRVI